MSAGSPRALDWQSILAGLAQLRIDNPWILERNVLVGGAACLFYRDQLERLDDPNFRVRAYTEEEERTWLSRDADFATTEPEKMPESSGNVPLGRLQMGFVLGAEEFRENARTVELRWDNTSFAMLIADSLDLWREKEAAVYRRRRPQDGLHKEMLETTLRWETVYYAEKVAAGDVPFDRWKARTEEVRRRWSAVLADSRLITKLLALSAPSITDFVTTA